MTIGSASRLGIAPFDETPPVEWMAGGSEQDAENYIRTVYRQVLGNTYVMESERLTTPESQFRQGALSVREFVRAVAKSALYRDRFVANCPRHRTIEVNFKHLLGRAPRDLAELQMHSAILDTKGFEADIDSYLDSEEYLANFGDNIVPYIRGYRSEACDSTVQFTHTFQIVRGTASSSIMRGTKSGIQPKLTNLVIQNRAKPVVSPNSDGAVFSAPTTAAITRQGVGASADGKTYRIEATKFRGGKVRAGGASKFRRANQVFFVPYNQLSETYQRIHQQGGVIASITPV
ncbi:MAG: phycobilisome linker polypeptide [Cyanobacteria bacterium P01_D01_bin.128]